MIRQPLDYAEDERQQRVSNSQPLSGWYRFIGWAGAFILCGLFWGWFLGKIFGR